MIPKIVHYCWFGQSKLPELAKKCINSWKEYLPDYEFILWNEDSIDINSNQYIKEAYRSGKYAFVTDYVRLFALFHYGGIYMDTDVEVLKSLDDFLGNQAFTGCESDVLCVTGIIGAEKGHKWIEKLLTEYKEKKFIMKDGNYETTPNTIMITRITSEEYGWMPVNKHQILKEGLNIYNFETFCAKDWKTGKIRITTDTYTIHHFSGSWYSRMDKFKARIKDIIGPDITQILVRIKKIIKGL